MRRYHVHREIHRADASFHASDLILVPNPDEADELAGLGFTSNTRVVPNGIPDVLLAHASLMRSDDPRRAADRHVAVIGTWDLRKGRLDWPHILLGVRRRVPDANVPFLGAGVARDDVLAELGYPAGVEVLPSYDPATLPKLLTTTKAGGLASYVEGFGLGLVEQMACGIPSVAYDVPGPRHTIGTVHHDLVVPLGDTEAFATRLAHLLSMDAESYAELAGRVRDAAHRYRYSAIAEETLSAYLSCPRSSHEELRSLDRLIELNKQ